jgi:hypothetical protein
VAPEPAENVETSSRIAICLGVPPRNIKHSPSETFQESALGLSRSVLDSTFFSISMDVSKKMERTIKLNSSKSPGSKEEGRIRNGALRQIE